MINSFKFKIIVLLKKFFHYKGFHVERIPTENQLYLQLQQEDRAVQRHELKRIASSIRTVDNHTFYNKILKRFVPDWNSPVQKPEFIGFGMGGFNLDVYRKVYLDEKPYLEKIYFNDGGDIIRMEWFYNTIYPLLFPKIKTCQLHKVAKGDLITIAYFDYIDLVSIQREDWQTVFFDYSIELIKLSVYTAEQCQLAPYFFKDYFLHSEYNVKHKGANNRLKELTETRVSIEKLEKLIKSGPFVFSHGDIYHDNAFLNQIFIDWDSAGFFPLGFEVANIASTYVHEEASFRYFVDKTLPKYKEVIEIHQWDDFLLNFYYFYFVFSAFNAEIEQESILEMKIMAQIEELFATKMKEIDAA